MSVALDGQTCTDASCPFPERCLEGFDDVLSCPHVVDAPDGQPGATGSEAVAGNDQDLDESLDDDINDAVGESSQVVPTVAEEYLLGGESLSLDEARPIMARDRGRVVLLAGDADSGKTTLVVELYARFLYGPFNGWSFGGSKTLRALDVRHFLARQESGAAEPDTARTPDDDIRLLHLNLVSDQGGAHLLFSDVRGEFFDDVISGAPVTENVQIAPRTDRCIVTIDGDLVRDPRKAPSVFWRAQLLIGGLLEAGGLEPQVPIAIVCTKWDLVPKERRAQVLASADELAAFASRHGRPAHVQPVSVRLGPAIEGLAELLDWLMAADEMDVDTTGEETGQGRYFWRPGGRR